MKNIFCLFLMLIVTGCSSLFDKEPDFNSVSQATWDTPPLFNLPKTESKSLNISKMFSPQTKHEGTLDYFETVSINGIAGEKFTLSARSICSCNPIVSNIRSVVSPEIILFHSYGEEVEADKTGTILYREINGFFPETGDYKLIVLAETKNESEVGYTEPLYVFGYEVRSFPIFIHSSGEVKVRNH